MQPALQSTTELLERILNAVDPPKRRRGIEIACAVVLSLATTASAWCAYQSKLWGGEQALRSNAALRAGREQTVHTLAAFQWRAFDASMFISYMEAKLENNRVTEEFLVQRFRPEMKVAVDAWLKLDPLNNSSAPSTPFKMAEYVQQEFVELARQQAIADQALQDSRQARQFSDNYVLLTVMFASVLFFGGIARAFDSRVLRTILALLALLLFLGTLAGLLTMPRCPSGTEVWSAVAE